MKISGLLLDDGWLTTDGQNIYVTAYGIGLMSSSSLGRSKVAVVSSDLENQKALVLKGTDTVTSAMVFIDDLAFVKVGPDIFAYDADDIVSAADMSEPVSLASIRSQLSHGSITINKNGSDSDYFIYYATCDSGTVHIIKYDSLAETFTDSYMGEPYSYCSQGIRSTQSGNLVFYDDSGKVRGFTSIDRNLYTFVIDDGSRTVMVESIGEDPAAALSSSGYGFEVNGLLYGARTSLDDDWTDGFHLYVLDYGVWRETYGELLSLDNGNTWPLTVDASVLPDGNMMTTLAGTEIEKELDYVPGYRINVDFDGINVTLPYAAYDGMVVRVYTNSKEDCTVAASPADLSVRKHIELGQYRSYSFVMPDQDVSIGDKGQPQMYTVELFLNGNWSSADVGEDKGWTYTGYSWTKDFAEGSALEIADPALDGRVFDYWDPAMPETVTSAGGYTSFFTIYTEPSDVKVGETFEYNGLVYRVVDADPLRVTLTGAVFETADLSVPSGVPYGGRTFAVTSVAEGAFAGVTTISTASFGDGLLRIYPSAFAGCSGLVSVTMSDAVKTIGAYAFEGCATLGEVSFPSALSSLSKTAFDVTFYNGTKSIYSTATHAGNTFAGDGDGRLYRVSA
ncbi:MAG: leucine-rich repeat domain-containing protein [Candidatus Methanomethylophilaceae archaeon]|nr:leucine-rich repeat domain-containing protein [Candidatus Methanomethylophilaceae archaeon]